MNQRVLIFSTAYFPLVGGAEVALKEITDRLPDFEFDLICARIKKGLPDTERIGNVTIHRCGFGHPIDKYFLPFLALFRARRIQSHVPVIWSLMASFGGLAALAYTWFHPRTIMLLTIQEGDPLEHYEKRAGRFKWLHRAVFRRANAVQAISTFLAKWATDMGFSGTPEVIPNGVDIAKFATKISAEDRHIIRSSYAIQNEDVVIVTASRLSLKNAIDDLIQSLTHLPVNYRVLIAGVGEDEEKLHALVKELELEPRVIFAGSKTHDELPALLQSCDVFVRASLSEGLGNAFLEAMAAGLPIVGTPVGGIPDFLVDGETGVFCEPRKPLTIATAVKRIFDEPGLRDRLVANGDHLVRERYDWNSIASRMKALIESLSNKR